MKSIAIICPYFGKFPENIKLTFYSMYKNNSINWYIFTDNLEWKDKYDNIHFIKMTFEQFQELVKVKIGTKVATPYKMCDYKPTYGFLFFDYIKDFDFWGYCDLDVIFGNLRKFISEEKLAMYDKIYELGHLSLFKNTEKLRCAFMGNENCNVPYKEILNQKEILVFDEPYCLYYDPIKKYKNGGINQILKKMGYAVYDNKEEIADLDVKYQNFYMMHWGKNFWKGNVFFEYKNGGIYQCVTENDSYSREVSYVHFQQKKGIPIETCSLENFVVTPKGYIDIENMTQEKFFAPKSMKIFWYLKFRLIKYIKNKKYNIIQIIKAIKNYKLK